MVEHLRVVPSSVSVVAVAVDFLTLTTVPLKVAFPVLVGVAHPVEQLFTTGNFLVVHQQSLAALLAVMAMDRTVLPLVAVAVVLVLLAVMAYRVLVALAVLA
jgi:hypothetical protein